MWVGARYNMYMYSVYPDVEGGAEALDLGYLARWGLGEVRYCGS